MAQMMREVAKKTAMVDAKQPRPEVFLTVVPSGNVLVTGRFATYHPPRYQVFG